MPLKKFSVAPDDAYWIYDATSEELKRFLQRPHAWVKKECSAVLAEHFVVTMRCFTKDRDDERLVMQGIEGTGVVHVSTTPCSSIKMPPGVKPKGEIILYSNPLANVDRPWRAYTHVALGDDVEVITDFLMRAAGSPFYFLQQFNDFDWTLIGDEGTDLFGEKPKVKFVTRPHQGSQWSPNDSMAIVYESVAASGDPPTNPPACNSKTGTAYEDDGTLVIEVETFTVKAWPKNP